MVIDPRNDLFNVYVSWTHILQMGHMLLEDWEHTFQRGMNLTPYGTYDRIRAYELN